MIEKAYFAGGCFWCITPTFKETEGVISVVSGYSGGDEAFPSYELVKSQKTGHRETVLVEYDGDKVGFEALLEIFLCGVDLSDAEGQFIDRGHSYTLAVYFTDEEQKRATEERIGQIEEESGQKVYVSIEPYKSFYPAEEEHQDYYLKHPEEFEKELIESGRKQTL